MLSIILGSKSMRKALGTYLLLDAPPPQSIHSGFQRFSEFLGLKMGPNSESPLSSSLSLSPLINPLWVLKIFRVLGGLNRPKFRVDPTWPGQGLNPFFQTLLACPYTKVCCLRSNFIQFLPQVLLFLIWMTCY